MCKDENVFTSLIVLFALILLPLPSAIAAEEGDVTTVTVTGEIQSEPACELNNGEDKVVSFGVVRPGGIESGNYNQSFDITFECDYEEIPIEQSMTFNINGVHADFDDGSGTILKVNGINGLGVKLFYNGNVMPLGQAVTLNETSGVIDLNALLVKNPGEAPGAGDFYATAVIQINLQ